MRMTKGAMSKSIELSALQAENRWTSPSALTVTTIHQIDRTTSGMAVAATT